MAAPAHNNFEDALVVEILTPGAQYESEVYSDAEATMQAGEPSNSTVGGARSLWWKYTPAHSGQTTFTAIMGGTSSRRRFGIYTGSAVNALNAVAAGSELSHTINVQAGVTYYIRTSRSTTSYSGTAQIRVSGQTTVVTRVPNTPVVTLIPEDNTLTARWVKGFQVNWEIRLNDGEWTPVGMVGQHVFTDLTIGETYTVSVPPTNSLGMSGVGSRTIVLPVMLVWDDFNRPNSTNTVGAGPVGPAPVSLLGTWGISGNELYPSAVSSNVAVVGWDCGTPNVDVRIRRRTPVDSGGIYFGGAPTGVNGWYAFFNGGAGAQCYVARLIGSTIIHSLLGRGGPELITPTSVLRLNVCDGLVEMWSDGHLLLRGQLYEPVTGTVCGVRSTATSHRWDDLTIRQATEIVLESDGIIATQLVSAAEAFVPESFLYRGRDTRELDLAGGA